VQGQLLYTLLCNMPHKYKSHGFRPAEKAGYNPLLTHIILHQNHPLKNAQYIFSVSCHAVLLQGTRSLVIMQVFKEWCQSTCNIQYQCEFMVSEKKKPIMLVVLQHTTHQP
jgi:hypothetical protein